jgi:hypothetical protein
MALEPQTATLRTYHVGFGDCFLLTFGYQGGDSKHVLIDFGTTQTPQGKPNILMDVAADIQKVTSTKLTAVIATHRHKDHIEGFRTSKDQDGPGDLIRECEPDLVLQPWTEDPNLETSATAPPEHKQFRQAMRDLEDVSRAIRRDAKRFAERGLVEQLAFLGENNLPNIKAVRNLQSMGKEAEYLHAKRATTLSDLLPGVQVSVLGPPTLEQSAAIKRQRSRDEEQFWHLWQTRARAAKLGFSTGGPAPTVPDQELQLVFPYAPRFLPNENPAEARWFRSRLQEMYGGGLLELVRTLDKVLNNTSLILLFEFRGKKLLFPGDAQIENWSYALDDEEIRAKLKDVDLYKVGHHGSLNATPKELWELFARKRREGQEAASPLKTVVSTLAGKHGHPEDGTEVPRTKLVCELARATDYYSTQTMEASKNFFHDIRIFPDEVENA